MPLNQENIKMSFGSKQNIGLVGAGYWGKNLLRVFNELEALKIVCDSNEKILEKVKIDYPDIKVSLDFNDLLNDSSLIGIIVATPAHTHYELAKQALEAGKNVFVEKPLALDIKQGNDLASLAKSRNLILMVGHLLLYHPGIIKLKELVQQGELGDIEYIYSNRLNFGKIRAKENALWSLAPHDISILVDFMGMPKKVDARGSAFLQKDISDMALIYFEFDNNRAGHIFVSWLNPFKEQKFVVVGKNKMAVYDGVANQLTLFSHKVERLGNNFLQAIKANGKVIDFPEQEPLKQEAKHFLNCLQTGETPKTDSKEALDVLNVLSLAQKSIKK